MRATAGASPIFAEPRLTGLTDAVLREIAGLVERLIAVGEDGVIDLRSLPMTDADRDQLKACLGNGEVRATIEVAGRSTVEETAIAGVWWVRHEGADGRVASEQIAVTRIPAILITHVDDLAAGAARLAVLLSENGTSAEQETVQ